MTNGEKIYLLQKLLDKSASVTVENSSDSEFKIWRNLVKRNILEIFGERSAEFEQFMDLTFYIMAFRDLSSPDFASGNLRKFREDFKILIASIEQYIEEANEDGPELTETLDDEKPLSKVFISHASEILF